VRRWQQTARHRAQPLGLRNSWAVTSKSNRTYDDYFALFRKLKTAVIAGDRQSVTKILHYAFPVNAKKKHIFRSAEAVMKTYDKIFAPRVLDRIRTAEPAAVFCRDGTAMLGNGVIWADRSAGNVAAIVLNQ
jgi:hypothetical protein